MKAIYATSALLFIFANVAVAGEFGCPCCQFCGGTCVLKVEQVEEEEACHDVECKEVCIPAVRFPWQTCRTPKCGRVRVVTKLKHDTRKVSTCKYEWVLTCPRCGRPVAAPKPDGKDASSGTKPAEDVPPMPPPPPLVPMPPTAPSAAANWRQHVPVRSAGKLQAIGFASYVIRSRAR